MKECSKCGITKFYIDFYPSKKIKDGYRSDCKECCKKQNQASRPKEPVDIPIISNSLTRQCIRCLKLKDLKNFNINKIDSSYCKKCYWEIGKGSQIIKMGISVEKFIEMERRQNGCCYICKKPQNAKNKRLSIDHDHSCCPKDMSCGKCVRGLLCQACNAALGLLKEDIDTLKNMISYIRSKKQL